MMMPSDDRLDADGLDADRLDRKLTEWFSLRGRPWSGTAAELLAAVTRSDIAGSLWLQSPRGLYHHLQSRKRNLQSLGVEVSLHQGVPRMVSLRPCSSEQISRGPLSGPSDSNCKPDPPPSLPSLVNDEKTSTADLGDAGPVANGVFKADIPAASSGAAERSAPGKYAVRGKSDGSVFVETGEALFAILEMRSLIREQSLDVQAAVDLVISRAQQVTQCCGVAVGFLPQETGSAFRTGAGFSMKKVHFHANLFQSQLVAGDAVQLGDAQAHPLLGAMCRRERIGSLIIVPIFRGQEVAGAAEFLFREKRSFSPGDVMDLELIAGAISESLGGGKHLQGRRARAHASLAATKTIENVDQRPGYSLDEKARQVTTRQDPTEPRQHRP